MRFISRLTAVCLMLLYIMMIPAAAEVPFLVHSREWHLDNTPLDISLTADVSSHMPFDDDRLAMLTPITDLLGMRLITGYDASSVSISVAGADVLTLYTSGNSVQLSSMPNVCFTADGSNVLDLLLGETVTGADIDLFGLRGDSESLLDEGALLLAAIPDSFVEYRKTTKGDTNISGMGKAKYRYDITIPAEQTEYLKDELLRVCPDGWLHDIIAGLAFSGRQTLRAYYNANDVLLRAEFTGTCGYEGDLRNVNLIWRMRRDAAGHLDEITLRTPAQKGTDKNNLTFSRSIKTSKSGAIEMTGEFAYTITKDKQSDVRKGDFKLTNAYQDGSDVIRGEINLRHLAAGDNKYDQYEFCPDLIISGTQDSPQIEGTLIIREKWGSGITEEALLQIRALHADGAIWPKYAQTVTLTDLSPEELILAQKKCSASIATALVRPIILQLGADAQWFFRDLDASVIQSIIDAANAAHE